MFSLKPAPQGPRSVAGQSFLPEKRAQIQQTNRETNGEQSLFPPVITALYGLLTPVWICAFKGPASPACWGWSPLKASKAWLDQLSS